MDAYIYQAALYCPECAEKLREHLRQAFRDNDCAPVAAALDKAERAGQRKIQEHILALHQTYRKFYGIES